MKTVVLFFVRFFALIMGFVASVSFMRAQNTAYNWYFGRLLGDNFRHWLNFGITISVMLLFASLAVFAVSIWLASGRNVYPIRKVDYLFLLVFCIAGFILCTWWVLTAALPWRGGTTTLLGYIIVVPLIAYFFTMLAFGELIARLRDRTLLSTLYWIDFFRVYSAWRPVGFLMLLLLASQMVALVLFFQSIIAMVIAVFVVGGLTYIAVHMINLSAEYDIASAEKIRGERFKSELITNVSHDIKTPLTSIINYVDLLGTEGLTGQAAEYVDVLTRKSSRLKVLIDDLMEASKAGTGNLSVDLQEINLAEIVGQVAGEFEDRFSDRGLTLVLRQPEIDSVSDVGAFSEGHRLANQSQGKMVDQVSRDNFPHTPVNILADSRHLFRALENLFANAAKYGLGGTRVFAEILPLPYEGRALFALQNTSELPIEMSGRELTEQFIRGDKARHTEGSGLGLYIARSLVELMGGSLDIHVIGDLFRVEVVLGGTP